MCCVPGVNGEVWIPAEDGKDLEENMEKTLVRFERRGAVILQVTSELNDTNDCDNT